MEYQAFCVRAQSVKGIDGTYRRRKEAGVEVRRCVALKFLYVSKVMMMAERNSELEIKICSNFESTYFSPSSGYSKTIIECIFKSIRIYSVNKKRNILFIYILISSLKIWTIYYFGSMQRKENVFMTK